MNLKALKIQNQLKRSTRSAIVRDHGLHRNMKTIKKIPKNIKKQKNMIDMKIEREKIGEAALPRTKKIIRKNFEIRIRLVRVLEKKKNFFT
jgi:hypothetical protein